MIEQLVKLAQQLNETDKKADLLKLLRKYGVNYVRALPACQHEAFLRDILEIKNKK